MANAGFKVARKNVDVTTINAQQIAFSSAYIMDKILLEFQGDANATKPHGLSYKPTVLNYTSTGTKGSAYVDNYQITDPASANNSIVLFQQGT